MINDFFIDNADYLYQLFTNGGFSGQLLLATPKKENLSKIIIKQGQPCSACCEFVYSRLAQEMHIPVPQAFLVKKSDCLENWPFKIPYAVGITYLDGLRPFTTKDLQNSTTMAFDYACHYALAVMFEQIDTVQMAATPSGNIVGFDFTDCFRLSDLTIGLLAREDTALIDFLRILLDAYKQDDFSASARVGAEIVAKHLGISDAAKIYPAYLEPMKRFCRIEYSRFREITEALDAVYPVAISVYFEEYLAELKQKILRYIESIQHNLLGDQND